MAPLHLAVALDGAGWHPAAWREPSARPDRLFTARYWAALARAAERGLLDLLTIEDAFGLQSEDHLAVADRRTDQVRGRLDAQLVAAFVAPLTRHVGLVPTVTTTHTEPFHIASAISTLDHDSHGRAGWRVQTSTRADEAAHFGRRVLPEIRRESLNTPETAAAVADLFEEAADAVEVVRRLWDSWEDGAEIRDAATGRFLDRSKVHPIDFTGRFFAVRGPGIVPRPPQGQPLVVALAHARAAHELAARAADADTGENFRRGGFLSHAQRYERAGEILDAVRTLWDSWGSDAVVADKAGGRFLRDAHVGDFAVRGTQFAVAGRFTTPRSPQGHPVVLQAGESPAGRDFAAARSDAIFSRYSTFAEARAFYTDVKARVARLGRDPEQVEILPSASVILGDTEAEARDRHRDVRSRQVDPFTAVVLVETVWSRDLSGVDPDGPVPDLEPPRGWTRSSTGSSRCGASAVSCGPPTPGRRCASTSACPSRPVSANPPRRAPPPDLVPAHPVLPKESRHDRQTPPVAVARPPRRRPGPVRVRRWGRRRGRR